MEGFCPREGPHESSLKLFRLNPLIFTFSALVFVLQFLIRLVRTLYNRSPLQVLKREKIMENFRSPFQNFLFFSAFLIRLPGAPRFALWNVLKNCAPPRTTSREAVTRSKRARACYRNLFKTFCKRFYDYCSDPKQELNRGLMFNNL